MTAPVILLCFFLAFCPLSVGTPLTCPPSFLNESAQQGSGRLCATLQLQTKLPCPSVNLTVRENEKLNPEKWHLESLSLKVEKACSFMVFKQDKLSHFHGGFYANITINSINTQSEFLCVCTKLHIRHRRTPTFYDFSNKHLVDNPADPSDNNYWQKAWDSASDYRQNVKQSNIPQKQSFMDRRNFNTKFSRDFKIKFSNRDVLYRSEKRMNIYDINERNDKLDVVKRRDYIVVDLDGEDMPIHYEPVPQEFHEPVRGMNRGQTLSIGEKIQWGRVLKWGRVLGPVAEEDLTVSLVGMTSVATHASIISQILQVIATVFLI